MDTSGITGKLTSTFYNNAEIIGVAGGTLAFGINPLIDNFSHIGEWGFPKLDVYLREFLEPGNDAANLNWNMIWLYVGGWALKELGFGGRLGKGLQEIAKGVVIGNAIQHTAHEARFNHT